MMRHVLKPANASLSGFVAGPSASGPIEHLKVGAARHDVRMMVASSHGIRHGRFVDLPEALELGSLVVVNDSATLPAAITGMDSRERPVRLHIANPIPGGSSTRLVEFREPAGITSRRIERLPEVGALFHLPAGGVARVLRHVQPDNPAARLCEIALELPSGLESYLGTYGKPIRYDYVSRGWSLDDYQTIFARTPGSSEMPSAGRPFSYELVERLTSAGVSLAQITLHTGLASLDQSEGPYPEQFAVSAEVAATVNEAHAEGRPVVAVGTTVVRALESATGADGVLESKAGFTDLVIHPTHTIRSVDALITGWHDPDASHLLMLEALVGRRLLQAAYGEAQLHCYRWHEFGDCCLLSRARV